MAVPRLSDSAALFVCGGFLLAACNQATPVGPTVPLNQPFVLAPGQLASIEGTSVRVQFVAVASDSRCPMDALCIVAGDATVAVQVLDAQASSRYDLHTDDPSRKHVMHRDVRIDLLELQPYPISTRRTDPAAYRATFRGSRQ